MTQLLGVRRASTAASTPTALGAMVARHDPSRPPSSSSSSRSGDRAIVWLDVLRIGGIAAVIAIHTLSPLTEGRLTPRYSGAWWVAAALNAFCLWCVPVYVMISGALLLQAPGRRQSARDFYSRRLRRIGVPLVFWSLTYLALRRFLFGENLSVGTAVHDLAAGKPFLQIYYLFVVAGLYALTPVLRLLLATYDARRLRWIAVAGLTFGTVDFTLADLFRVGGQNAVTQCVPFIGYFLAGAWLARSRLPRSAERIAGWAVLVGLAATVLATAALSHRYGWTNDGYYFFGYQSPTVVAMSLGMFTWARARAERRGWPRRRWIATAGAATFGVFLLHPLVLLPLLSWVGRPTAAWSVALGVPVIVGVVALASGLATLVLERVPVARRLVS
jgi:surface polysaccharide O-acyltransferase-like enzyme